MYKTVEKNEFDFITSYRRNDEGKMEFETIKLFTLPYITANMK
jgi:hypothetical protein